MDTSSPTTVVKRFVAVMAMIVALLGATLTAAPAAAAPAHGLKTYLEYYQRHVSTAQTRYLNRSLHRLTDPLRAPDKPVTVKKVSGIGYAAFGFDCGVQLTHTKGKKAHVYTVTVFTFGRLDQPAKNALDYPYAGKHADRHVLVVKANVSPSGIDRALKSAHKGCS